MKKLIIIEPIDMIFLLIAGSLISALGQLPDDELGGLWLLIAFILAFALSYRSLLAYLWMAVGLVIIPAFFVKLGIYKLTPVQDNFSWEFIISGACDLVGYYLVMHVFVKTIIYLCKCAKRVLVAVYKRIVI